MRIDISTGQTAAHVRQITTSSLGDHSYVVVVDDEAIAIDIQRDLDRFEAVLEDVEATLTAVFETHIHNDYVSGGKRLADGRGATYVLPANTGAPYPHQPLADGETIPVGSWHMRAMHTPGHTHNHTSYVLESEDGPVAVFSGGSMLVGAVGRSDLLGEDHTERLLADQYRSVHRIAGELPDPSLVAPTHGSGSFCSASNVADSTSTIGRERMQNPALLAPTLEAFAMSQVIGYRNYPTYYRHMAAANLQPMGAPPSDPLRRIADLDEVEGVTVVDVRPFAKYAVGHVPGSISIEVSNDTAVYMGWTLPWASPVVLVGSQTDVETVRRQLARIGWDAVIGWVSPETLDDPALDLSVTKVATFRDLDIDPLSVVVDVRDPVEHRDGIIEGAVPVHVAEFVADPLRFGGTRVLIHCQSGYRAAVAAGFAEAAGADVTVIADSITNYRGDLVALPS